MLRKTHLVGAWPGMSAPQAIDTALKKLGPHLLRMSDGETGQRSGWVQPTMEWLRVNPDVELEVDQPYVSYEVVPRFRVRDGRTLDPENIHLGYYHAFSESYPAFRYLREQHGQPQISFQVGVPAPLDLAVDAFGFEAGQSDRSLTEGFRKATVRQIESIHAEAGDDVLFQIETVLGLVSIALAPPERQAATAEQIASGLHALVADSPKGTRFGAHLCLGDLHHKAFAEMADATPLVLLANALVKDFPADQTLDYIHAPFAAADKPGTFDERWYKPLEELDIPSDIRFVAGFIHEDIAKEDHRKLLQMIEGFAGREVDVAAACGLGRRPDPEQAWDAMDKAISLIEG